MWRGSNVPCPTGGQKESDWGEWLACDKNTGTQMALLNNFMGSGARISDCPDAKRTKTCAVDCEGEWGIPTKCINGNYTQKYVINIPAKNGGRECPKKAGDEKKTKCSENDCITHPGMWGWNTTGDNTVYTAGCNGDSQYARLNVVQYGKGSTACPATSVDQAVIRRSCKADCEGVWGACDSKTGKQIFTVTTQERNGGTCPQLKESPKTCKVDCVMNEWGSWGTVDTKTGLQSRTRTVKTPASGGGKACGSLTESQSFKQDCVYSTKVGDCDPITKKKETVLTVTTPARGGGTACPTVLKTTTDCAIDCIGVWNPDGKGCDSKTKKQKLVYKINMDAIGGKECTNKTGDTKVVDCDVDCVEGYAENWGQCIASTGKQTKTWNITTPSLGNGKKCKTPTPSASTQNCKVDCDYKYEYAACVDGKKTGTLKITSPALNGGKACPTETTKKEDCNTDCVGKWGEWTPANCPNGTQTRTYEITQKKYNNGKACPFEEKQTETQVCVPGSPSTTPPSTTPPSTTPPSTTPPSTTPSTSPDTTEPDEDCVGSWGDFGDCIDGKKSKTYTVTTPASGNGKACETYSGAKISEDCSGSWYTNPLILGGISLAVIALIFMVFLMMGKKSSVPVV
jgi:hypothetical protein